jgi:hypothetical protein
MNVFLSPLEIAGQVSYTAEGLRALGHGAVTAFPIPPALRDARPTFHLHEQSRLRYLTDRIGVTLRTLGRFDIYHYYNGTSLLAKRYGYLDARMNKALGKCVCVEYCGTDVRLPSIARQRNPYYVNAFAETAADEDRKREEMARWATLTGGHAIITDVTLIPYLEPFFSNIHCLRHRLDVQGMTPHYPHSDTARPLLVHAPSNPAVKGTAYIRAAVESLRAKGRDFAYCELTGMSHATVLETLQRADLVLDQLTLGHYGVFAVEAMSLGKPTICFLLPEVLDAYPPELPIINANPDTVGDVLDAWLANGAGRHQAGRASRAFAETTHDYRVVAQHFVDLYRQLLRNPADAPTPTRA